MGYASTLYLVAEQDVYLPLAGMYELFDRTPGSSTGGRLLPSCAKRRAESGCLRAYRPVVAF
jgi:hypothetical protein